MKDTKSLRIGMIGGAIGIALLFPACQPNPTSQGKPLSEWIVALDDSDNAEKAKALLAISKIPEGEAARAKKALRKVIDSEDSSPIVTGRAGTLLALKLGETSSLPIRPIFIVAIKDRDQGMRLDATRALKSLEKAYRGAIIEQAIWLIEEDIPDPDHAVSSILKTLPGAAIPALRALNERLDKNSPAQVRTELILKQLDRLNPAKK